MALPGKSDPPVANFESSSAFHQASFIVESATGTRERSGSPSTIVSGEVSLISDSTMFAVPVAIITPPVCVVRPSDEVCVLSELELDAYGLQSVLRGEDLPKDFHEDSLTSLKGFPGAVADLLQHQLKQPELVCARL